MCITMKLAYLEVLIAKGALVESGEASVVQREIETAIAQVACPPVAVDFTIFAQSGRKRGGGKWRQADKRDLYAMVTRALRLAPRDAAPHWCRDWFCAIDAVRATSAGLFAPRRLAVAMRARRA